MINIIVTGILTLFSFVVSVGGYPRLVFPENGTLKISPAGEGNSIVIDSVQVFTSAADSLPQTLSGPIEQTGNNNSVQISIQKKPRQNMTINQTDKNNKVKINSH